MTPDVQKLVEDLADESCIDLFAAYGVTLTPAEPPSTEEQGFSMTGVVGFTGPGIWGMCLLAGTEAPLRASMPSEGELRDWIAELSNQLVGRVKHKLIAKGTIVYITTPIVLRGVRIQPVPRRALIPRAYNAAGGTLLLWVEVEVAPDFSFSEADQEEVLPEGDTILF